MADWYTPTQVQKALETTWMKLENTTTLPLKVSIPYIVNLTKVQNICYFRQNFTFYLLTFIRSLTRFQEVENDLINYYDRKQHIIKSLQYDLYFYPNKLYDPKEIKDCGRSQKEIHNNIYNEVCIRHK